MPRQSGLDLEPFHMKLFLIGPKRPVFIYLLFFPFENVGILTSVIDRIVSAPQIHVQNEALPHTPVCPNVTIFRAGDFKEVIKFKRGR